MIKARSSRFFSYTLHQALLQTHQIAFTTPYNNRKLMGKRIWLSPIANGVLELSLLHRIL